MILVYPTYYDNFRCIADRCEDTCCAGWEIDIDDETYDKYLSVGGDFGARLIESIKTYGEESETPGEDHTEVERESEDEGYELHGFRLSDDLRCPFLDDHNLCDIYKELGESALCEVCTNTPRNYLEYCDRREISISASCPEAARLIYGSPDKITFISKEVLGKIDVESDEEETELGEFLIKVRDEAIRILQDRSRSISERIDIFMKHSEAVQEAINNWESSEEALPDEVIIQSGDITDIDDGYMSFLTRMSIYSGLASIGERWADRVQLLYSTFAVDDNRDIYLKAISDLNKYMQREDRLYEYEHLLVYYAFLLLNRSIDDYDYLTKAKLVVMSYYMNRDMDAGVYIKKGELTREDRQENARIYAREVEHAEENMADLEEELMFS